MLLPRRCHAAANVRGPDSPKVPGVPGSVPTVDQDLSQGARLFQGPGMHGRNQLIAVDKVHLQCEDAEQQVLVGGNGVMGMFLGMPVIMPDCTAVGNSEGGRLEKDPGTRESMSYFLWHCMDRAKSVELTSDYNRPSDAIVIKVAGTPGECLLLCRLNR